MHGQPHIRFMRNYFVFYTRYFRMNTSRRVRRAGVCSMHGGNEKCIHKWSQKIRKDLSGDIGLGGSILLKYKETTGQNVRVCTNFHLFHNRIWH